MSDNTEEKSPPTHADDAGVANGTAGTVPPAKPSFRTKAKRHCGRFWWIYVIILIVVVLVVVLPVVYVAYPKWAQDDVNDSTLNITSMSILSPTADSFHLESDTVLTTHSKYHPHLDAWNGSLYLEGSDVAFAQIESPAMKANNGAVSHINQTVQIANTDQYTEYATTVMKSKEYTMMLRGEGKLKEGGLPKIDVDYDKELSMKGLNGLAGFNVTSFHILTTALPDGSNANGTVLIPNPTVMTLAMGNVTMSLSVDGTPIGLATINDLVLKPGNNTLDMVATNNLTALLPIVTAPEYSSGILPIDIVGNTSTYHGVNLPYYEAALRSNPMTVSLDVGAAIEEAGLADFLGLGSGNDTSS